MSAKILGLALAICLLSLSSHRATASAAAEHQTRVKPEQLLLTKLFQCVPYNARTAKIDTSILTYKIQGRLGNQMLGLAMVLALRKTYGFQVFLETEVLRSLQFFFPASEGVVAPLESFCHDHIPWIDIASSVLDLHDLVKGHAIEITKELRLMGNNLLGMGWGVVLPAVESDLRGIFKLDRRFVDVAQHKLALLANEYWDGLKARKKNKKPKKPDIVFVGVHVRLTDAVKHMVERYNMPPLNPSYYFSAIDLFRDKFKHVVFVLVSDDIELARKRLVSRSSSTAIFAVGNGDVLSADGVGEDLALLSQCNHTILSYGTFSFWAGFLSGGLRVIPSMIIHPQGRKKKVLDMRLPPFTMTDYGLTYYSDEEKRKMLYL